MAFSHSDVDIGSGNNTSMVSWSPPGHWPKAQRKAYARSIEFLRSIANGSPHLHLRENRQTLPDVMIQGVSRRWYRVNTRAHYVEDFIDVNGEYREVKELHWRLMVEAAAWRSDLVNQTPFAVSLCMHPHHTSRHLPIGDQIAALALALRNDKITGMRIPLLAQFIVAPRAALNRVHQFTEQGVIMEDDVEPEEMRVEDELEDDEDVWYDDHVWYEHGLFDPETFEHVAAQIENQQLDDWMERQEREANEEAKPWHHDVEEVWQFEETLRRRRR